MNCVDPDCIFAGVEHGHSGPPPRPFWRPRVVRWLRFCEVEARTWHAEATVVALVLFVVWLATGARPVELLGSIAVLFTFMHAQVGDRLAEKEAARARAGDPVLVACHHWMWRYYVSKEAWWLAYFVSMRAWSALVGCAVFMAYPVWRRVWRSRA
jgi:hypothetical protein